MNNAAKTIGQETLGKVEVTIVANGQELPQRVGVIGIVVTTEVNCIPKAKLFVFDGNPAKQDFEISNEPWLVPGSELEIYLGSINKKKLAFRGVVVKHQITVGHKTSILQIDCRHKAYRMTLRRQSRVFNKVKDSDLAKVMIEGQDLQSEVENTVYMHEQLVQYDTSDWHFLVKRMEMNGLQIFIENDRVKIASPDFNYDEENALRIQYGKNIVEFDAEIELRDQIKTVETITWDPVQQKPLRIKANDPQIKLNGNIKIEEITSANGAESILHRHGGNVPVQELQSWANARILKDRLSRTQGRIRMLGHQQILPGQIAILEGLGNRMNGPVYITGLRHEFKEGQWLTDISFGLSAQWESSNLEAQAPSAAELVAGVSGLQIGRVFQVTSEPGFENRIKVRLPIVDTAEGFLWARIATLDAGPNRGTVFRPEIDDEVIVGFINDDPRDGIILGMLHSNKRWAPINIGNDNDLKGYQSRSGLKVLFNDADKSICLETPGNNRIKIAENKGISLSDEHGNKVVMDEQGLSFVSNGQITIDSRKGIIQKTDGKISINSRSNMKLKGQRIDLN